MGKELLTSVNFRNSADINKFFSNVNGVSYNGFVDYFNRVHGGKGAYGNVQRQTSEGTNNYSPRKILNESNWNIFWDLIPAIYNKPSINIVEFIALNSIQLNENPTFNLGTYEGGQVEYLFNKKGLKASYNTIRGNKTCFELFNDPNFIQAHGGKPLANLLTNTTDTRWQGGVFPSGFSGNANNPLETDSNNTFLAQADFCKFRGIGAIQITLRSNYKRIVQNLLNFQPQDPVVLQIKNRFLGYGTDPDIILTKSTTSDWQQLASTREGAALCLRAFFSRNQQVIDINRSDSEIEKSLLNFAKAISGGALTEESYPRKIFLPRFNQVYNDIIGQEILTPTNPPEEQQEQAPQEEENNNEQEENNQNDNEKKPGALEFITNFERPNLKIEPINFKYDDGNESKQKEVGSSLGFYPFVWYNGFQIEPQFMERFELDCSGAIPRCRILFKDQYDFLEDIAFPLDDTIFKVFINSRSSLLRNIFCDFKLLEFKVMGQFMFMEGILNVESMWEKKNRNYGNNTTWKAVREFCKENGLGYNSNISNTNDAGPKSVSNVTGIEALQKLAEIGYKDDDSFMWLYMDLYYNINYIDLETALKQDISNQKGLYNIGANAATNGEIVENSDLDIQDLYLTNDKAVKDMNIHFSEYTIINRSTKVSLDSGYKNNARYYDSSANQILDFKIDTLTDSEQEKIQLKGKPGDNNTKENTTQSTYTGKQDNDNSHPNQNYAKVQNTQNISALQKIGMKIKMPTPNFNIYKFMKIKVYISSEGTTPSASQINNRLSGEWMIMDIKYVVEDSEFYQEVTLIRRDLSTSEDEKKDVIQQTPPAPTQEEELVEEEPPVEEIQGEDETDLGFTEDLQPPTLSLLQLRFKNSNDIDKFFSQLTDPKYSPTAKPYSNYYDFLFNNFTNNLFEDFNNVNGNIGFSREYENYRTFWNYAFFTLSDNEKYDEFGLDSDEPEVFEGANIIEVITISTAIYIDSQFRTRANNILGGEEYYSFNNPNTLTDNEKFILSEGDTNLLTVNWAKESAKPTNTYTNYIQTSAFLAYPIFKSLVGSKELVDFINNNTLTSDTYPPSLLSNEIDSFSDKNVKNNVPAYLFRQRTTSYSRGYNYFFYLRMFDYYLRLKYENPQSPFLKLFTPERPKDNLDYYISEEYLNSLISSGDTESYDYLLKIREEVLKPGSSTGIGPLIRGGALATIVTEDVLEAYMQRSPGANLLRLKVVNERVTSSFSNFKRDIANGDDLSNEIKDKYINRMVSEILSLKGNGNKSPWQTKPSPEQSESGISNNPFVKKTVALVKAQLAKIEELYKPQVAPIPTVQPPQSQVLSEYPNKIVEKATSFVGQKETPNNSGFENADFQKNMEKVGWQPGNPWNCFFVELVWRLAMPEFEANMIRYFNGNSIKTLENFKPSGIYKFSDNKPVVGSLMFFKEQGGDNVGQVGIVIRIIDENTVETIEGNTADATSIIGNSVQTRIRYTNRPNGRLVPIGFIYPPTNNSVGSVNVRPGSVEGVI